MLIIAPHPDDELINCGAILSENKRATIIYINSNSKKRRDAVIKILPNAKQIFLNYNDCELINKEKLQEAMEKIKQILYQEKPEKIYIPAYEGGHVDHDIAHLILVKIADHDKLIEYTTYHNHPPIQKAVSIAMEMLKLKPAQAKKQFINPGLVELFGNSEQVAQKNKMIEKYIELTTGKKTKTRYGPDLYRKYQFYDYTKPPHSRFPLKLKYEYSCKIPFEKIKEVITWLKLH